MRKLVRAVLLRGRALHGADDHRVAQGERRRKRHRGNNQRGSQQWGQRRKHGGGDKKSFHRFFSLLFAVLGLYITTYRAESKPTQSGITADSTGKEFSEPVEEGSKEVMAPQVYRPAICRIDKRKDI